MLLSMAGPTSAPRFYVPHLGQGDISLSHGESHHALHVLRLRVGDAVELFDGRGGLAEARVASVGRRELIVSASAAARQHRLGPDIHICCAVPKGARLDWLLEKATELGAASIRPVLWRRSVAGGEELSQAKRARWLGHCIAAAKQCGLNWLPELCEPLTVPSLAAAPGGEPAWFGDLSNDAAPLGTAPLAAGPLWIAVGPEGGIADDERSTLLEAGWQPVRLGHTTLRIETAAISLLAAAVALAGR
jgi:16S rRNA (uracil1498-N3)-methyltransferase